MTERILRKPEVRSRVPVGKTKFEEDIAPRLDKVYLGPRCVGFTESSVERLIKELIAESATRKASEVA
jgi:predicted DNA-binding transcriptional regulator AlpA